MHLPSLHLNMLLAQPSPVTESIEHEGIGSGKRFCCRDRWKVQCLTFSRCNCGVLWKAGIFVWNLSESSRSDELSRDETFRHIDCPRSNDIRSAIWTRLHTWREVNFSRFKSPLLNNAVKRASIGGKCRNWSEFFPFLSLFKLTDKGGNARKKRPTPNFWIKIKITAKHPLTWLWQVTLCNPRKIIIKNY